MGLLGPLQERDWCSWCEWGAWNWEGGRDTCSGLPRGVAEVQCCPQSPRGSPPCGCGLGRQAQGEWARPVRPGVLPTCVLVLAGCLLPFPPHPTASATSLRPLTLPCYLRGNLVCQPQGSPFQLLGVAGERGSYTKPPSPRKEIVIEFVTRSKGGRGSPSRSVCHDQVGLVCLCVFFGFFFFKQ